jgi:CPA1 family monovalent cation:H+ antiporter
LEKYEVSTFQIMAILLTISATFAWLNVRIFALPTTIGLLLMGLAASLVLVGLELLLPQIEFFHAATEGVARIDFPEALLNGMLGYLLFAGALHVDFSRLRERGWIVGAMASFGVLLSTVLVATGFWAAAAWFGVDMPYAWALVFGALISPTDPIAVLATLRNAKIDPSIETDMAGESLFNDGVSVVLFSILLNVASGGSGDRSIGSGVGSFMLEAGGGLALGLAAGYISYRAMRTIDDYSTEVLISLALVTGSYALAVALHLSGPIAVVVAGVLIGNHGVAHAMSDTTQRYLFDFWKLVDEILNSVLFLLIGLEVVILRFEASFIPLALAAIPIVLLARFVSVSAAVLTFRGRHHFPRGTIPILTWGGVRGGISVALALTVIDVPQKPALLAATYLVAIWTMVVQGLTLPSLVRAITVGRQARGDIDT